jgi:hypothetical protein
MLIAFNSHLTAIVDKNNEVSYFMLLEHVIKDQKEDNYGHNYNKVN